MTARLVALRAVLAGLMAMLLLAGGLGSAFVDSARADMAPLDPANPTTPTTVTADPLPTAQMNGVAWAQVVVGNTVYVAGKFTSARPAGAPLGTQEVPRNNLLAYDIRTGALITSFAPSLNAQANAITASPDGSRIYVGGDFTQADGQPRSRIAAYSTATGQLISDFKPAFGGKIQTLAATSTAVYAGGWFNTVGTTPRKHLAAVSPTNGALLPWAPVPAAGPVADPETAVRALVVTSGGAQVVIGGHFGYLNGVKATGVGAVDATTGATRPFAINQILTNEGVNSAIFSLTTQGDAVYGTGYVWTNSKGTLEGAFAAAADGGALRWLADCHGDSYSNFPANGALYIATHAHECDNIGGFPEQKPQVWSFGTAVSLAPAGKVLPADQWNANFTGKPAPALLPWYPRFTAGSFTGQWQAGWTVTGNNDYVVYGGEFPRVNNTAQQGLVRFAMPALAPNKVGPETAGTWTPSASAVTGAVRVAWKALHDRDNENLTYSVHRDSTADAPVCRVTRPSTWWNLPTYACADLAAPTGAHRYLVTATDPAGNTVSSAWASITVPATSAGAARGYTDAVRADGAVAHWSLNEKSGATAYDDAGPNDLTVNSGVTRARAGAIAGDADTAFQFSGTTAGYLATTTPVAGPQTVAVEAWFQTTSRSGGKIIGFGDRPTGNSGSYDRHVYLDAQGRVLWGVYDGTTRTVSSPGAYNDGKWHHVVASLSRAGMTLHVDGQLIATRADATSAQAYNGYWRIGGDTPWTGSGYLAGLVDEPAVYPSPLTTAQIQRHYDLGRGVNLAPTASFTSVVTDLTVRVDGSGSADADGSLASYSWDFGSGAVTSGATASHTFAAAGTYPVTLTVTDDDGATSTVTRDVTVTAPPTGPGSIAADTFGREVPSGWGSAERGGAWTVGGGLANARVTNGAGQLTGAAGRGMSATLAGVSQQDVTLQADITLPEATTGNGAYVSLVTHLAGTSDYRATLRFRSTNEVELRLDRLVNGTETILGATMLPGTYTPGSALTVRLETAGATTGTTTLKVKAWAAGSAEPAAWMLTRSDGTASLQRAGALRVETYTSGSSTRPAVVRVDNLRAEPTGTVVAPPANAAPTAAFTAAVSDLTVSVDGSGSADGDGSLASYSWDFGGGITKAGVTASHTFAAAGTHPVTLTVTDDDGATGTVTRQVTVTAPQGPANVAPTASFTSAASGLSVTVDGSGATDSDGTIRSHSWDFGGGVLKTGATASHTYPAAGTYPVTLTVTDDDGATGAVTREVTVTAPATGGGPVAADTFEREVASGWGSAELGGAWTITGGLANARVTGGSGQLTGAAGRGMGAALSGLSQQDVTVQADITLPEAATGTGSYVSLAARRIGTSDYRATLRFRSTNEVELRLDRLVNGTETILGAVMLPGTYTPGTALTVRLETAGAAGSTTLKAKAWAAGTAEPAGWRLTRTDGTASLQAPGQVLLETYTSGSATRAQIIRVDNVWAGAAGQTPAP